MPYTEQGSIQPFGYTGYHYSSISAAYHALAREYNPLTGCFLSRDSDHYLNPDEPQSLNQYLYCLSNPLRYTDPYGHEAGSINQKLTATGIRDTFLGGIKSMYEDITSGGIQNSLSQKFDDGLAKVKKYGTEMAAVGKQELLAIRDTGTSFLNKAGERVKEGAGSLFGGLTVNAAEKMNRNESGKVGAVYRDRNGFIFAGAAAVLHEEPSVIKEKPNIKITVENEDSVSGDSVSGNVADLSKPTITKEWLKLYDKPTVDAIGRSVKRADGANKFDWAMPEDTGDINLYGRIQMEKKGAIVIINSNTPVNGNIFTDSEGRYWIAIGPKVLEPTANLDIEILADNYNYGTKIDIHVKDKNKNEYYIPAVVGDIKEHSGPEGLYQTGNKIPENIYLEGHGDGSSVEFIGDNIKKNGIGDKAKSVVNYTNDYELIEIIVYDDVYNFVPREGE